MPYYYLCTVRDWTSEIEQTTKEPIERQEGRQLKVILNQSHNFIDIGFLAIQKP